MCEAATVAEAMIGLDHHPAWILLDIMLPDGSGIDVLRYVREQNLTARVCIITGCGYHVREQARRLGADHIFVKPLDVDQLIATLT